MNLFDIIFAKMNDIYKKNKFYKNKIFVYINVLYFFVGVFFLIPITSVLEIFYPDFRIIFKKYGLISIIVFFGLIALVVNRNYLNEEKLNHLSRKYSHIRVNKILLYIVVIIFPILLLLSSGIITVILKGGTILNWEFNGLLKN